MRQEVAKNPPRLESQESQARGQIGKGSSSTLRVFPKRQYLWKGASSFNKWFSGGMILHHPASLPQGQLARSGGGEFYPPAPSG